MLPWMREKKNVLPVFLAESHKKGDPIGDSPALIFTMAAGYPVFPGQPCLFFPDRLFPRGLVPVLVPDRAVLMRIV